MGTPRLWEVPHGPPISQQDARDKHSKLAHRSQKSKIQLIYDAPTLLHLLYLCSGHPVIYLNVIPARASHRDEPDYHWLQLLKCLNPTSHPCRSFMIEPTLGDLVWNICTVFQEGIHGCVFTIHSEPTCSFYSFSITLETGKIHKGDHLYFHRLAYATESLQQWLSKNWYYQAR